MIRIPDSDPREAPEKSDELAVACLTRPVRMQVGRAVIVHKVSRERSGLTIEAHQPN